MKKFDYPRITISDKAKFTACDNFSDAAQMLNHYCELARKRQAAGESTPTLTVTFSKADPRDYVKNEVKKLVETLTTTAKAYYDVEKLDYPVDQFRRSSMNDMLCEILTTVFFPEENTEELTTRLNNLHDLLCNWLSPKESENA